MIQKEITLIVSSNPNNGAQNLSADGSSFEVNYQGESPTAIPAQAKDITVEVQGADIWWTVPNVISGVNDKFKLTDTGADSGTVYTGTVTIAQGLYDLQGLANAIETQLVNAGAAQGTISFSADTATQKVLITANFIGISIDFTIADSVRNLLGFNSQVLGPSASKPFTWIADNVAAFNQINYFLIHGDIADRGLPFNDDYSQVLAQVLIDVSPGSQITFNPFNPSKSFASRLRGQRRTTFRYWLTDDQNRLVNTAGEYWSARLVIRYQIDPKYAK
jgi:hypothetical protein